jgi:nucleoid DNA-binding protein
MIAKDLKKKNNVNIENFGEFRIVRQNIKIEQHKNNQILITPPKDIIDFKTNAN